MFVAIKKSKNKIFLFKKNAHFCNLVRHIVYRTQSFASDKSNMADENHDKKEESLERIRNDVSLDRNREGSRSASTTEHRKVFC